MINNVTLVGRITRDPELRYTPQNQAVATFSLAVNRQFKNANGDREADFINCVIWRQQAENLANWAKKGALIGITGRIQTRNYENQQGQRIYVTEVVADSFQMLESRQDRGNVQTPQPAATQSTGKQTSPADPHDPFASSEPMTINDDDLPF
ncbi:single-stranded DNA-binding protein [Lactococcus allomyrinae]|uniref:Single-stranded DNA-binding protein n=1 Tax=Lactococcus allomyrinae TaxID=2419773 RepID=A0A387BM47_9LACT|nr:single-stranded DNA-binding protein [Lactococcus allomyrinae]AYG02067.1 single-stranded DNA-binding protein [Lactococcus allomyrinae]